MKLPNFRLFFVNLFLVGTLHGAVNQNVWFHDQTFDAPFIFENETKNVIVCGNLSSEYDITFKVKNFLNLGSITSTQTVLCQALWCAFNAGKIVAGSRRGPYGLYFGKYFYNTLGIEVVDMINALFKISLEVLPSGQLRYIVPD